ncbi:uncharacterized protein [Temnothorax longispinosus]|uniref:uncharacterized protein n=1 Tax=Temnothorax longispinosus TaxID=300112 RepID=UPI003A9923D8
MVLENSKRIVTLEQTVSALARKVVELRELRSAPTVPIANEQVSNGLVISGVPAVLPVTPLELVHNVFAALNIKDLMCRVINVRPMVRKALPAADRDRSSRAAETSSIAVTLTACAVRDEVMSKMRTRRVLKQSDVCGNDSDRKIYVNEMLPKATYDLLNSTRRVAKEKSYKYVWIKRGRICVRLSDGKPTINIDSESGLAKLL